LHLLTASFADAQAVLSAASSAGFRESGAMGLSSSTDGIVTPMVAVRSAGLGFDSIIGYQNADGNYNSLVTEEYLELLVNTANERFKTNTERIERFRSGILSYYDSDRAKNGDQPGSLWENKDARKARKRAEGLARQKEKVDEVKANMEVPHPDTSVI
jgi:tRNA wybutosine-synthesizing protein 3